MEKFSTRTALALAVSALFTVSAFACTSSANDSDAMAKSSDAMMMEQKLPDQRLAAHFVSSNPKHGETLGMLPEKLSLNFDFTLAKNSTIAISKDGAPLATMAPEYDARSLMMSTALPKTAGAGTYVVSYKACWPDQSCHDGLFAFVVKGS